MVGARGVYVHDGDFAFWVLFCDGSGDRCADEAAAACDENVWKCHDIFSKMIICTSKPRIGLSTNEVIKILREKGDVTDRLDVSKVAQPLPIRCNDWPIMTWGRNIEERNNQWDISYILYSDVLVYISAHWLSVCISYILIAKMDSRL